MIAMLCKCPHEEITFDDAEYMLLQLRILDEFKKYVIRKEFIDLYEEVMI